MKQKLRLTERRYQLDFENVIVSFVVFFLLWVLAAALYTRVAPKSNLLKTTVGL
jgi:hypothetical protein